MVDNTNRLLAGRYEVGELIGRGGMAEVHIGRDTRLGRTVAIKILRSDLARDPAFQVRFRREAQAAAALNHPAIVAVYDTGEDVSTDASGQVVRQPFIVMEYIEGRTVRDLLRGGNALEIDEAIDVAIGVLSALQYSHQAGIVHRDIKPANVMITPTGAVKVMDFGIARALADSAATMTQTQTVVGTAQYLSPEQARGEEVDTRSDLYSTGCLFYEMLTGRPPFIGDSAVAVAYQHVQQEPAPPSSLAADIPPDLDAITLKALAKDRDLRYSTASEFRGDLETFKRGGHIATAAPVPLSTAGAPTEVLTAATAAIPPAVAAATPAAAAGWAPITGANGAGPGGAGLVPEEDPEEEENNTARNWIIGVLVALGIAAIVLIVWVLFIKPGGSGSVDTPSATTQQVKVPPVTENMTESDARNALAAVNLVPADQVEKKPSDTVPKGMVVGFNPKAGTAVDPGSTVTIIVSSGDDNVTVPNVLGFSETDARKKLEEFGLVVDSVQPEDNSTWPKDTVARTDPAAESPATQGQGVVLYMSTGNMEVPDLRGKPLEEAQKMLRDAKLGDGGKEQESTQTAGTVLSQDQAPNTLVPQGTVINYTYAVAPATVSIPNITNVPYDENTQQALIDAGLRPVVEQEYDPSIPSGNVTRTDPGAGTSVDKDTIVKVYVSMGPSPAPPTTPPVTPTSQPPNNGNNGNNPNSGG